MINNSSYPIPEKEQVILADNLFTLAKGAVDGKDIDTLQKLYEIIITLYDLADKTNYDFFYDLGEYVYSAIDNIKDNKPDDGWMAHDEKSLLDALNEARRNKHA